MKHVVKGFPTVITDKRIVVFILGLGLLPGASEYMSELHWEAQQEEVQEKFEQSQRDKAAKAKQCADRWVVTEAEAGPVLVRCA